MMSPEKNSAKSGRFKKGVSGNPHGRPKGVQNKASIEIREAARSIIESPKYRESLRRRLISGKAQHMEPILFYYAYGKPADTMKLTGSVTFEDRLDKWLRDRDAEFDGNGRAKEHVGGNGDKAKA